MSLAIRGLMTGREVDALGRLAQGVQDWASIVEVGTHTGFSTCHMAVASRRGKGAHITAIDPYLPPRPDSQDDPFGLGPEGVRAEFHRNLTTLGLWSMVTPLRAVSLDVARMWQAPIGLLFIDAIHERQHVIEDYEAWSPHIIAGGVLALHDYNATGYPGVVEAVEEHILPTGCWERVALTESLWTARRTA